MGYKNHEIMKAERSLFRILTLFVMHTLVLSAGVEPSSEVQVALKHAGGNRNELKTALREVNGKDAEYLIAHASQYDLVNLTSQQIIENVTYARKVHAALPYLGGKLEYELWRDWVLPHRVLEEDVSLWRKDFYERMQPVIAGKTTTAEAAEAIRYWLWGSGGKGQKRVSFGPAENRQRTPSQSLNGGTAACGELAALHVSFLRAVGIPARHCCGGWEQGKEVWHFYAEYWDNQLKHWVAMDDIPTPPVVRVQRGGWRSLVAHATPGFNGFRNAYFTGNFTELLEVTENLGKVEPFQFQVAGENDGDGAVATWNTMTWRTAGIAKSGGADSAFQIALGTPKDNELPVLATVVRDNKLQWGLIRPGVTDTPVVLQAAQPGVCLRWPKGDRADDSQGTHTSRP